MATSSTGLQWPIAVGLCGSAAIEEPSKLDFLHFGPSLPPVCLASFPAEVLHVMEYTMGRLRDWSLQRGGLVTDVLHV